MRWLSVAVLLAVPLLSGCFSTDYDDVHADATEAAREALLAAATGNPTPSSFNLELIGYHNGIDNSGDPGAIAPGRFNELALRGDYVYLSRSSQGLGLTDEGTFGGFSVVNVQDPMEPYLVGTYAGPGGSDIEVNEDNTIVFFGTQRNTVEELVGGLSTYEDPRAVLPRGIYIVNVEDKATPTFDSFVPVPYNGVHTITYVKHPVTSAEYVIASVYDLYRNTVPSTTLGALNTAFPEGVFPLTQRVIVFELQPNPLPTSRWTLAPISTFQIAAMEMPPAGRMYLPHDTFVQQHPRTGQVLLYVAYWDKGVRIVDFDDPAALDETSEIGSYADFSPSAYNNIHQVRVLPDTVGDTVVLVAEPEIISADETGQITFLDVTEPSQPERLGFWAQPDPDLTVNNFDNSPHNFDVLDGQVALAHQGLGIWIIDVSNAGNLVEPKTVGFYFPGIGGNGTDHGMWGVWWEDDEEHGKLLYAADSPTGLHILRYTGPRS
jgi:hypothetical protein